MAEKEYIERGAALAVIAYNPLEKPAEPDIVELTLLTAQKQIRKIPAADVVEVRHGEWIEGAEHFTNGLYEAECSECNNYIRWNEGNSGDWNYCPHCGAKMDGERKCDNE